VEKPDGFEELDAAGLGKKTNVQTPSEFRKNSFKRGYKNVPMQTSYVPFLETFTGLTRKKNPSFNECYSIIAELLLLFIIIGKETLTVPLTLKFLQNHYIASGRWVSRDHIMLKLLEINAHNVNHPPNAKTLNTRKLIKRFKRGK